MVTLTMSERVRFDEIAKVDIPTVQNNLGQLVGIFEKSSKVETYTILAEKLSAIAHKENPWSWRYVQSVHTGSIAPSEKFTRATELLVADLDNLPAFIAETEQTMIFARPGTVHPNSILLSESKGCSEPTCTIHFIPRVPWQKYCPMHKDRRNRTQ